MKVLFDHPSPFLMAHGGCQIQIERTKAALSEIGVDVEFLRWWDGAQKGDIIHRFGVASVHYLRQAKSVNLPVVMTTLFSETCNRSDARLVRQGWLVRAALKIPFGAGIKQQLHWQAFNACTHNVVGLEAERQVLKRVYSVPENHTSVVPLGLSETYLRAGAGSRSASHLICTGTIVECKNSVTLAQMARAAKIPILFVGKPYHPGNRYWSQFKELIDNEWVKYHPHVHTEQEMVALLKEARGFVLMSDYENWCLSAHEAAACGLPLLVQNQKWSRERFGDQARYFESIGKNAQNIDVLRQFWMDAPKLPSPKVKLYSWTDVALRLKAVYDSVTF